MNLPDSSRLIVSRPGIFYRAASILLCPKSSFDRRFRLIVIGLALLVGGMACYSLLLKLAPPAVYQKDILAVYLLTKAAFSGLNPYLPLPDLARHYFPIMPPIMNVLFHHPSPHPPTLAILAWPLGLIEYQAAARLWFAFEFAGVVAAVHLLGRLAGRTLSWRITIVASIVSLAWSPLHTDLVWGQLNVVMVLCLTGMLLALRRGRCVLSGALWGLSLLVKPVFWPIGLVLLLHRRWQVLGSSVAVVLSGYLIAGQIIGYGPVVEYFARTLGEASGYYRAAMGNISLWAVGWKMLSGTYGIAWPQVQVAPPLLSAPALAPLLSMVLPCLALFWALMMTRNVQSVEIHLAAMISVAMVINPIAWDHYLVVATIPAVLAVGLLARNGFPSRLMMLTSVLISLMVLGSFWQPVMTLAMVWLPVLRGQLMLVASLLVVLMPSVVALGFPYLAPKLDTIERAIGKPTANQMPRLIGGPAQE